MRLSFMKRFAEARTSGLIGRLTSRVAGPASNEAEPRALAGADLETLKATLQELLECKRLLDQTRQN